MTDLRWIGLLGTASPWVGAARTVLPLIAALAVAWAIDRVTQRSRFRPPGFDLPGRRVTMGALLAGIFYFGTFLPVAWASRQISFDPQTVAYGELFLLHGFLVAGLGAWFVLGYSGSGEPAGRQLLRQCGLSPPQPLRELLFGLAVGPLLWLGVILAMAALAALLLGSGASGWLPEEISPMITYMAALPVAVRFALSLSAGVVEEAFFRGFLQRRLGILASSGLFVVAHVSYGQPLMLVGIALLSLSFAFLTRWRGNVLPAAVAHTLFDAVQLFWLIPSQLVPAGSPAVGIC